MAIFSNQTNSVDNAMESGAAADTNYGTATDMSVGDYGGGADITRSLIKWDLSSIPATATVTSATLSIYVKADSSSNARTMSAYRVLRNWGETTSTWNKYDGTNNWGTVGCANTTSDREVAAIGTASIGAAVAPGTEIQISLTAAKVQEWLDGTLANYGLLLKVDTENTDAYTYHTHEAAASGTKPKLVINYTYPGESVSGSFSYFM